MWLHLYAISIGQFLMSRSNHSGRHITKKHNCFPPVFALFVQDIPSWKSRDSIINWDLWRGQEIKACSPSDTLLM